MRGWRERPVSRPREPAPNDPAGDEASVRAPSRASLAFDPSDPAFVADPYPVYEHLRETDPVHRSPAGPWVLTRYADVEAALADTRLGNAPARYAVVSPRNRERYVCADVAANILPFVDPPAHMEPRRVIGRLFFEHLRDRPPDVEATADALLERWAVGDTRDVVADYASPLAVAVISDVLGIPRSDARLLEGWSEAFFRLFAAIPSESVRVELDGTLTDFRRYLEELAADEKRFAHDGLFGSLLLQAGDGGLTRAQVIDNAMLLFADGVENVDRAIGNSVYALLRHPQQLALLRERPDLLPSAIDECLRFESPAQHIARIVGEDVEIEGVTIPAQSAVLLVLGSANRDPRAFERADSFDVERRPNPHLAFGRGRHSCLGGPLVERLMLVALQRLMRRFPHVSLTDDHADFIPRPGHRWIARVRVRAKGPSPLRA